MGYVGRNASLGDIGDQRPAASAQTFSGNTDPIRRFGQLSAGRLIERVRSLPPAQRTAALRAILDSIDKTLWPTVEVKIEDQVMRGVPAATALEAALATSLSNGALGEVITVGKKRRVIARPGQIGFAGLGATTDAQIKATAAQFAAQAAKLAQTLASQIPVVKIDGYNFVEYLIEGVLFATYMTPTSNKQVGWKNVRKYVPRTVTDTFQKFTRWNDGKNTFVEPDGPSVTKSLWRKAKDQVLAGELGVGGWTDPSGKFKGYGLYLRWLDANGGFTVDPNKVKRVIVVLHKNPPSRSAWDKFKSAIKDVASTAYSAANIATVGTLKPIVRGAGKAANVIGDGIAAGVGKVADVVEDGINAIKDGFCDVISSDLGKGAAIAAGTAYAGGPTGGAAAGAGADIIASKCNGTVPVAVLPPPVVPSAAFPIVPVLAAAGGITLLLVLSKRRSS